MREQTETVVFVDDDREGFQLRVTRSNVDGDFYLAIIPNEADMARGQHTVHPSMYANSMRVRMPFLGGGSHAELFDGLMCLWRALGKQPPAMFPTSAPTLTAAEAKVLAGKAVRAALEQNDRYFGASEADFEREVAEYVDAAFEPEPKKEDSK